MVLAEILKKEYYLSDEQVAKVISFAEFLEAQNKPKPIGYREDGTPYYRKAGIYKGKGWLSDDFDEPLDDFKEYME